MKKAAKTQGIIIVVMAALALAVTNVMTPLVYSAGTNPSSVLMLRGLVTFLFIGAILLFRGKLSFLPMRDEINCLISGLLFIMAGFGLLNALQIAPVSIVVLILYLFPLLTTIFDAVIRRAMPTQLTILLLLIALAGLALALDAGWANISVEGMLLAFMAAVGASSTMVWNNHKLANLNPEQITLRMFAVSFVVFAIMVWRNNSFAIPNTNQGMLYLIVLLLCFAFAFFAMFRGNQMVGSVNASMMMNLEPIASIFLSVLVLSEVLTTKAIFGTVLVLSAVILSQLLSKPNANSGDLE